MQKTKTKTKTRIYNQVGHRMPVISALKRLWQDFREFKTSLNYTVWSCLKITKSIKLKGPIFTILALGRLRQEDC